MTREWSDAPHPGAPDRYWQDDATDEAVCAFCARRAATIDNIIHSHGCDNPDLTGDRHHAQI